METQSVTLHGIAYEFPKEHIFTMVIPPEGRLFVRLASPYENFHMILDEWGDRPSHHGPSVPTISHLTDNRFGKFVVIEHPDGRSSVTVVHNRTSIVGFKYKTVR